MSMTVDELCKDCPEEFKQYMSYAKSLEFEQAPDYKYMLGLITGLAKKENIDLNDQLFDWNIRAITIKKHSYFFDFISNLEAHPFDRRGRFCVQEDMSQQSFDSAQEMQIYADAKYFKFDEPKQLVKLIRKEELKRLKSKNFNMNNNPNKKNDLL